VRALLAQLAPEPNGPAANVATVVRALQDHPPADLAVFTELFISGYDPREADALAVPAGDGSDVPCEVDYLLQGRPDLVVRSHAFAHSQGGL
jgi:hypothetical protein